MAPPTTTTPAPARSDPHSHADFSAPFVSHADLAFYVDFSSRALLASALLTFSSPISSGDAAVVLDVRNLSFLSVALPSSPSAALPFSLTPSPYPFLGSALTVSLPADADALLVTYSTSSGDADAAGGGSALQWLPPSPSPFVYTQCQSIHARSIFPCHDTPAARITFTCLLNLPRPLAAAMAARRVARRDPVSGEHRNACSDSLWCASDRIIEEFAMDQPIPPYLFAFAAGDIVARDVGPRTRVHVAGGEEVLEAAAREFASTEELIVAGERLFGPYDWERFDLLVLPPNFPYGGMENPRMVFLTPTVIKGDATGAQVVAHELAHSWTGNLITNRTNEDFWLNEGFTTYAERRIVEAVQGPERAALNMGIGWRGLNRTIEGRFKESMEFTKLKTNLSGVDPDEIYSDVPYEKGFQFLWRIEREIGRPQFDEFIKKYIATFKFQSIDTDTFIEFLKANVPGIEERVDLVTWVDGTGIPSDAMEPVSAIYDKIKTLASEFATLGKIPTGDEVAHWSGQEWELYLENLPTNVEASQVLALDTQHHLSESRDYEVKVAFLELAIKVGCRGYFEEVERVLKQVGRMKYLRPLYRSLTKGSDECKVLARRVFAEARLFYHPIAQGMVDSILAKHT